MDQTNPNVSLWRAIAIASLLLPGCTSTRPAVSIRWSGFQQSQTDARMAFASEWNTWADGNLHNGDLVFMQGDCYILLNTINFSELATDLTASRFAHIGLVSIENGEAYVYDIRNQGCLRTRFGELPADRTLHQLAVKRCRTMSSESLSETARFCRGVFERRERFDNQFKLDNDRYYCAELVEEAYRSAGRSLSDPIAIRDLPNFGKHPQQVRFIRAVSNIVPEQEVLVPGNDQIGIWANPDLELVLDLPDAKVHPPQESGTVSHPGLSSDP